MDWIIDFLTNPYFVTGMSSWLIAQVAKTIIYWIVNKKFDITRLFGDGGMPSGHSATVISLATISALVHGPASFEFAVSATLAVIVCHDATGVRQETGKQAILLNQLIELVNDMSSDKIDDETKLKEFVGHTIPQVIAGALVGLCNATVLYFVFFA